MLSWQLGQIRRRDFPLKPSSHWRTDQLYYADYAWLHLSRGLVKGTVAGLEKLMNCRHHCPWNNPAQIAAEILEL